MRMSEELFLMPNLEDDELVHMLLQNRLHMCQRVRLIGQK